MGAFITGLSFGVSTANSTIIKSDKAKVTGLSFGVSTSNSSIITNRKGVIGFGFMQISYWEKTTRSSRSATKG